MKDANKQARQAAWICFQPYLNEEQLLAAISILDHEYQIDSAISLITYVKKIATQFGINDVTRKTLHIKLHQLMQSPLADQNASLNQLNRLEDIQSSWLPQPSPKQMAHAVEPVQEDKASRTEQASHARVFAALIQQISHSCPYQELLAALADSVNNDARSSQLEAAAIKQWQAQPDNFDWINMLAESALINMMHKVYTAVCELLGPVQADHCFHEAITCCEKLPEAKLFSPGRFF